MNQLVKVLSIGLASLIMANTAMSKQTGNGGDDNRPNLLLKGAEVIRLHNTENDFGVWNDICEKNSDNLLLTNSSNCYSEYQKSKSIVSYYMWPQDTFSSDSQLTDMQKVVENMKINLTDLQLKKTYSIDVDKIAKETLPVDCPYLETKNNVDSGIFNSSCAQHPYLFSKAVYLELEKQCLNRIIELEIPDVKAGRPSWGSSFYSWPVTQQAATIVGCVHDLVNSSNNFWEMKEIH